MRPKTPVKLLRTTFVLLWVLLPLLGALADWVGLEPVLAIMGVFTAWLCVTALRMSEPRGHLGVPGAPVAP